MGQSSVASECCIKHFKVWVGDVGNDQERLAVKCCWNEFLWRETMGKYYTVVGWNWKKGILYDMDICK